MAFSNRYGSVLVVPGREEGSLPVPDPLLDRCHLAVRRAHRSFGDELVLDVGGDHLWALVVHKVHLWATTDGANVGGRQVTGGLIPPALATVMGGHSGLVGQLLLHVRRDDFRALVLHTHSPPFRTMLLGDRCRYQPGWNPGEGRDRAKGDPSDG